MHECVGLLDGRHRNIVLGGNIGTCFASIKKIGKSFGSYVGSGYHWPPKCMAGVNYNAGIVS